MNYMMDQSPISDKLSAVLMSDFYKFGHPEQYPEDTQRVYSTWTPRATRLGGVEEVVCFGPQKFVQFLHSFFHQTFFSKPWEVIEADYKRFFKNTLGQDVSTERIKYLHDLGYLPLEVKALPEGTLVPLRIPYMTIVNTDDECFWLTNFVETMGSSELWQMATSATISYRYRKMLDAYALETGGPLEFVQFQGHDFSFRGMGGIYSAMDSGMGHMLGFKGTDTAPAITALEHYYDANIEQELVGTSVWATEHSVMCAGGDGENEFNTFDRLISKVYPMGIVSIVSDTWDFWGVLLNFLPRLKDKIMSRDGKVVIRPDSGDPVKIVCGDPDAATEWERKGAVEVLWDLFGGTTTEKGFKQLDDHIGLIYGDAITYDRCKEICERLKAKGFATTNLVYGIGSFTYQYNTRDTLGFALKSTHAKVAGLEKHIQKDPKTDDGTKKSACGRVAVYEREGTLCLEDRLHADDEPSFGEDLLQTIYENGQGFNRQTLSMIRERLGTL